MWYDSLIHVTEIIFIVLKLRYVNTKPHGAVHNNILILIFIAVTTPISILIILSPLSTEQNMCS